MIKIADTNKGIPLMSLDDIADITQVNKGFNKIDELLTTHEETTFNSEKGVHGARYYNKKFEINTGQGWVTAGGGASIPPKNVSNIDIQTDDQTLIIKWSDPTDLIIDGSLLSKWGGTKVVYKIGDYAKTPDEGTEIVNNTERDKYKNTGVRVSNLSNDVKHYITFFPYSDLEVYNIDVSNRGTGTPTSKPKVPPNPVTGASIKVGNTQLTIKWTDPIDKADATWQKTKVVYKEGSYPKNDKDGTLVVESTTRDQYKINGYNLTGLTNNTEYYFTFFVYSVEGGINKDVQLKGMPKNLLANLSMTIQTREIINPDDKCKYTGALRDEDVEPQSSRIDDFIGHYPVLLKDGREVVKIDPAKFTHTIDGDEINPNGSEGDWVIAFPQRATKIKTSTVLNDNRTDIALHKELTTDFDFLAHKRGDVIKDKFYVGVYLGTEMDGKLRSLPNKMPQVNMNLSQAINLANANGEGYEVLGHHQLNYLKICYLLKYKSTDSQSKVGKGVVENNTMISTGGTETNGMDWGTQTNTDHVKCLGIEDLWGNCAQWISGAYFRFRRTPVGSNAWQTASELFTTTNDFVNFDQYQLQEVYTTPSFDSGKYNGYIATLFINGQYHGYLGESHNQIGFWVVPDYPIFDNGSSTTHFCDYAYTDKADNKFFYGIVGGDYTCGVEAGIFYMDATKSNTFMSNNVGARLMYL